MRGRLTPTSCCSAAAVRKLDFCATLVTPAEQRIFDIRNLEGRTRFLHIELRGPHAAQTCGGLRLGTFSTLSADNVKSREGMMKFPQ